MALGVSIRLLTALCGVVLVLSAGTGRGIAPAHAATKLADWAGYWTGLGKVVMTNGQTEQVKCVVTYKVADAQLNQKVRCASQSFTFNGAAELQVASGGAVTGNWTETTYSANGDVKGRATEQGFSLTITGVTFTATMDAATTSCKQTLNIVPTGLSVERIAINLGKC